MNRDFWLERWERNEIGFHQESIHRFLPRYWPRLDLTAGTRVFVPLCGKSRDMLWLRDAGFEVIGVELSGRAAEDFSAEHGLAMTRRRDGAFDGFHCRGITIYVGDFFELAPRHVEGVTAVFDRAALVALPPLMRARYAAHMATLQAAGTQTLLVSFEYDQTRMGGPPFSVPASEVRELYAGTSRVELLQCDEILDSEPRFRSRGLAALTESAWLFRRL